MDFEKYLETINLLNKAATAYYRDDSPFMSDGEYDRLYREVVDFEWKNPSKKAEFFSDDAGRLEGARRFYKSCPQREDDVA